MKKIVSLILCAVMLLTLCISLGACDSPQNSIDYGKKYLVSESAYFVFYSDHTGVYEINYDYEGYAYSKHGQVKFVWEEASDGAVYLFETETTYYEGHTGDLTISVTKRPIYFSEDFLVYTTGDSATRAVKEGSDLEKLLKED